MSSRGTRIAALIAAILVGLSYFFPLWGYSIYAPQYPEGLYMTIWSDHVGGDVRNVNILNHYVGMKAINDSQFPEFKIAPVALLTFSVLALFLAVVPWLPLFWIWISGFVVGGVVGMWDLARWGYDFGTQLSDYAPIKIPGMHFVPPLLGKKIMLNITSYSYPHVASYMLAGAFLPMLWVAACALPKRHAKVVAVVLVIFGLQGCLFRSSPEPIVYGSDTCSNCQMTISDNRFGGETLLKGGKVSKFDSL
ncbi:MAG: hypothetical protein IT289_05195, partial [Oligoflexia bacterium]|nr:hypothetical protein [Oligoflexia bacterium]